MNETILFGGYTRKDGKGIYQGTLDTNNPHIQTPELLIPVSNPTYLAVTPSNLLLTVEKKDDLGGVACYDLSKNPPEFRSEVLAEGAPPAYVAFDVKKNLVFGANYHKGEVLVYSLSSDGQLTLTDTITHTGSGPKPEQDSAHVHFTDLTPDGRLVVCDLGMDELTTYDVTTTGKLTKIAVLTCHPGFGTRHLIFHPTKPIAYLLGELSSEIGVLSYDTTTGSFKLIEMHSMLPADFHEFNGAAAIRVSNDGKFLYASNRGHNSIIVFAISEDGLHLSQIQLISTEGDFPRDFNLDPTQSFVVAANQKTGTSTLYKRNSNDGKLTLIQEQIKTPEAVCVHFC